MFQDIAIAKDILAEWSVQYQWFPLRYSDIEVAYLDMYFCFTENGFHMEADGIEVTLNEMSIEDASICVRLLPEFQKLLNSEVENA